MGKLVSDAGSGGGAGVGEGAVYCQTVRDDHSRGLEILFIHQLYSRFNRRPCWWGGVVNLFGHVTAFNQSVYSIDQSN